MLDVRFQPPEKDSAVSSRRCAVVVAVLPALSYAVTRRCHRVDGSALNARYLARRADGLRLLGSAARLCHAEVL